MVDGNRLNPQDSGGNSWKRQTGHGASKMVKIQVREERPENHILENTRGISSGAARGIEITQSIWIERRWTNMKNTRQEKGVDTSYVGNEKLNHKAVESHWQHSEQVID